MIENKNQIFGEKLENTNPRLKAVFGGVASLGVLFTLVFFGWSDYLGDLSATLFRSDVVSDASPVIISIDPLSGGSGEEVRISGTNFSSTVSGNTVQFGDLVATVTDVGVVASGTHQLVVRTPEFQSKGPVTVKVKTNQGTAISTLTFEVKNTNSGIPSITELDPKSGPIGTVVYLKGENLPSTMTGSVVSFGGIAASDATIAYQNQKPVIKAVVPDGARSGTVSLATNGINVDSEINFRVTVSDSFPYIDAISAMEVSLGDKIQITGTDLRGNASDGSDIVVKFNDAVAKVESISRDTFGNDVLLVIVPDDAINGYISIIVNGKTAISKQAVTILNALKRAPPIDASPLTPTAPTPDTFSSPQPNSVTNSASINLRLTAIPDSGAALLAWEPMNDPEVANYYVYYSTQSGVKIQRIAVGLTNPFYVTDLIANKKYYFEVRGVDAAGAEIKKSNEASLIYPSPLSEVFQPHIGELPQMQTQSEFLPTPVINSHSAALPQKLSEEGPRETVLLASLLALICAGAYVRSMKSKV